MVIAMSKKLKFPLRIQFLVIALSLAVTTTVLGLSAYLTDTDIYQGTFRTALGDELGFKLTGDAHEDEAILPGGTVDLNVCAEIDKPNDLYLFVELDIPSDFEKVGFNSTEWHPISEGSDIYYFGNATSLVSLGKTNGTDSDILDGIKLSTEVEGGESYTVTITGYAIQADNISTTSPTAVFEMIGGQNENP
jgi:hypothetical protein